MSTLTLFAAPKPYVGEAAVAQLNALGSWARLEPAPRVILIGDEEGIAGAARRISAVHVEEVERTPRGTPRVDSVFAAAHGLVANGELLCYVNADLVLLDDFVRIASVGLERFLVGGRRLDVPLHGELSFEPGWQRRVRASARRHGRLAPSWGSDYFAFRADGTFASPPPFALGRAGWDNWMFGKARLEGIPVVDATRALTVLHPVHAYGHVAGSGPRWEGPETEANRELARAAIPDDHRGSHLWDATHVLGRRGARPVREPVRAWRRLRRRRDARVRWRAPAA